MPWGRHWGGVPHQVQPGEGVPCRGVPCPGGYPAGGTLVRYHPPQPGQDRVGYPTRGYPGQVCPPGQVRTGGGVGGPYLGTPPGSGWGGGYPGRTTEGVLNTRRAVCLLRSGGLSCCHWIYTDTFCNVWMNKIWTILST